MRVLLDTQLFLWAVVDSPRLTKRARDLIEEAEATFVSAASVWEIAIKSALGRLEADASTMPRVIEESGFLELAVSARHAAGVELLPPHHKDPFDRLLVAQAVAEPLRLMTADSVLQQYSELVILV
jgi:PIN domain nuclease of toxin-antitoxin system